VTDGDAEATFFTICNADYFPGTVAVLDSLRLTGNRAPLAILDTGLLPAQRARLEQHATILEAPSRSVRPWLLTPFTRLLDQTQVLVIIDSDMLVTAPLTDIIKETSSGKICLFEDHVSHLQRWFPEWKSGFALRKSLRRETYVNAGFIALSPTAWPDFLSRFAEVSNRLPAESLWEGASADSPYWAADQDALNALLLARSRRRHRATPFDAGGASRSLPGDEDLRRAHAGVLTGRCSSHLACLHRESLPARFGVDDSPGRRLSWPIVGRGSPHSAGG
jgi:hypothetical protein